MEMLGVADWKKIGKDIHSTAYKSPSLPGKVLVRSMDDIKRLLADNFDYTRNSKHLPQIEYLQPDIENSHFHWYVMPEYHVGIPKEGTPSSYHYKQLLKNQRDMRRFSRIRDRNINFLASNLFTSLPESLQEEWLWLAALVEDYGEEIGDVASLDLHGGNIAVDDQGNLILLDVFLL